MFFSFLILSGILSQVLAGQWTLDTTSSATIVAGVGTSTDGVASAAASQNGVGAFIETYENGKWTKKQVQAGMLLDTAITPSGNVIATSVYPVFLSTDQGQTFTTVDGLGGACQSANVWGDNQENFALVGSWAVANPNSKVPTSVSGVAYSTDSGKTWAVSSSVPPGYARYGAFPSANTWYVSSGMWADSSKLQTAKGKYSLSQRFEVGAGFDMDFKGTFNTSETGWFGAVSKTTDGGKTWTQVFQTDLEKDTLYFNGISCSSESHCAVAGEGYDEQGNYKTVGYVTFDGGVTWTASLTTGDVGLMQIKLLNELEGWAAGTAKSGRNIVGQFYHTTDGGKTWSLQQSLNNCFAIDMDFAVNHGFAACSSSSGSSCSVAVYA